MVELIWPVVPYRGLRGVDRKGDGSFGSVRSQNGKKYPHKGLDILTEPGDVIVAPISGKIAHIGKAYSTGDLGSIHIMSGTMRVKLLYVECSRYIGSDVVAGATIGLAQDVAGWHGGGMENHVHLEVYDDLRLVDPSDWLINPNERPR